MNDVGIKEPGAVKNVIDKWKAMPEWQRQQVMLFLMNKRAEIIGGHVARASGAGFDTLSALYRDEAEALLVAAEILALADEAV